MRCERLWGSTLIMYRGALWRMWSAQTICPRVSNALQWLMGEPGDLRRQSNNKGISLHTCHGGIGRTLAIHNHVVCSCPSSVHHRIALEGKLDNIDRD